MTLSAKIELNQVSISSSIDSNCQNDIHLFPQQFDNFRVNGDTNSHLQVTGSYLKVTVSHISVILMLADVSIACQEQLRSFRSIVVII